MEKRYQVFVSSTFLDLKEERRQVIQALMELDCIPAGMEMFPAADEEAWSLIERAIDDCDYYVVIIGGRYGSQDARGLSFTEKEYDYAVSQKLPVLGFTHSDPTSIPAGKSDIEPDSRRKLERFRSKVRKRLCKDWRTPEELGGVVSRSLIKAIKSKPAEGWIRGRFVSSPEEINALRAQIDELESELEEAAAGPPEQAEGLAAGGELFSLRFFYSGGIFEGDYRILYSWDELFATVGPALFDEASETVMKSQIRSRLFADMKARAEGTGHQQQSLQRMRAPRLNQINVNEEDFQTIKVQFIALGLLQKSVRKRGVRDTATYWSLTRYGERYATSLKAIRSANETE